MDINSNKDREYDKIENRYRVFVERLKRRTFIKYSLMLFCNAVFYMPITAISLVLAYFLLKLLIKFLQTIIENYGMELLINIIFVFTFVLICGKIVDVLIKMVDKYLFKKFLFRKFPGFELFWKELVQDNSEKLNIIKLWREIRTNKKMNVRHNNKEHKNDINGD